MLLLTMCAITWFQVPNKQIRKKLILRINEGSVYIKIITNMIKNNYIYFQKVRIISKINIYRKSTSSIFEIRWRKKNLSSNPNGPIFRRNFGPLDQSKIKIKNFFTRIIFCFPCFILPRINNLSTDLSCPRTLATMNYIISENKEYDLRQWESFKGAKYIPSKI